MKINLAILAISSLLISTTAFAATYYVRSFDSKYPVGVCNGQGESFGTNGVCCFNGLEDLQSHGFPLLKSNDEVYVIGTHVYNLSSGSAPHSIKWNLDGAPGYITFRGDHADAPGIYTALYQDSRSEGIGPKNQPWKDCTDGCPDGQGGTITKNGVYYNTGRHRVFTSRGAYEYFNSPDDYLELELVANLEHLTQAGQYYLNATATEVWIFPGDPANLSKNNVRWSGQHGYNFVFSEEHTSFVKWRDLTLFAPLFIDEHDNANSTHLVFDNVRFIREKLWRPRGTFRFVEILNCEWDGKDKTSNFFYPWSGNSTVSDLTIQGCYIHNAFCDHVENCDGHAIGFQGSSALNDNFVFRFNRFQNVGDAITLWHGVSDGFDNVTIAYNWITADYQRELNPTTRGCGIVFSSSNSASPGINSNITVAYNIVAPPQNCSDSSGICVGIRSNWRDQINLYGNVIDGANTSFRFYNSVLYPKVDMRNNISLNPRKYHLIYHPMEPGLSWVEDYNLYWPLTSSNGKPFLYGVTEKSFEEYNQAHLAAGLTVNTHTRTNEPKLNSTYQPSEQSNVVDSADSISQANSMALGVDTIWPSSSDKPTLELMDQNSAPPWDMGAFVYEDTLAPSPPLNLQTRD